MRDLLNLAVCQPIRRSRSVRTKIQRSMSSQKTFHCYRHRQVEGRSRANEAGFPRGSYRPCSEPFDGDAWISAMNPPGNRTTALPRSLRGRGYQADTCDLRRNAKTIRWSPVAGAAAYVDPQVLQSMQAAGEGLEQMHEQVPRPELPAMRMTRDLYIETCLSGSACRAWLMRE